MVRFVLVFVVHLCVVVFFWWAVAALNCCYCPAFRKSTTEFLMKAADGQKQVSLEVYEKLVPPFISANVLSLSYLVRPIQKPIGIFQE